MRSLEIFSGAGGLAKGLELAGFEHTAFIEHNKDACDSLRANFDANNVFCGDIQKFNFSSLDDVDIVAGGPPCQPFSLGGKHVGELDTRDMFPFAIRSIVELRPKIFVFENVKGLLRQSFSEYFEYILLRLRNPNNPISRGEDWRKHLSNLRRINQNDYEGLSYRVSYKLINAANYGVPQLRERVFIVGVRSDIEVAWEFPKASHSEDSLLWAMHVTGNYWRRHGVCSSKQPKLGKAQMLKVTELKRKYGMFEPEMKPWRTIRDALSNLPDPKEEHSIKDHVFRGGAKVYPGHTGSYYDRPAKTIKAGGHGVPGGENMIRYEDGSVRYFTVREAKRIQTFPDDFIIHGSWGEAMRQIGNAVPVDLAKITGLSLAQCIIKNELVLS